MSIHLPTAYLIAGLLYLVMPLGVWLSLRRQRSATIHWWCIGGVIFGLSLILLGSREQLPDWLTHVVANTFLFLGVALRVIALRHALGRPLHWVWLLAGAVIFALVYEFFHGVLHNEQLRFIWGSGITAALLLHLAWLAFAIDRRDNSPSARWVAAVYLALGLVLAMRSMVVLLNMSQAGALNDDILTMLMVFLGVLSAIVGNIGFMGVFLERLTRQTGQLAMAQARNEESVRLSHQIAQLDRRRSVGEIAASLAHELSQPLTNIYLIAERAHLEVEKAGVQSVGKYLGDIERNTQNAVDILNRIRKFIQSKESQFERVSLNQVVKDIMDLTNDWILKEAVDVSLHLPAQAVWVMGDPVQLSQILMNICRNAIQATQGQAYRHIDLRIWREGNLAHLSIRDNGMGLTPEVLAQVSTAFFSTKSDGLGVGLSISKSIATHHGGSLTISNAPQGGAEVHLILPALA
ncbi:sensor histidine kinase [Limnohabitans planktonicus]|uniref:histidine kinase n=1 Tax=Limnohabitans planktonicus II-D5 TaxID=1293045 RepID=A0A2T7U8R9_9BURK|nr:ATP-binding protein [Limnohabitans planktonicus]PVE41075.1 two-component sensor histidine kinase [Limnohabitans planktonicus II-D5]|eukprot:gene26053-32582_t